MNKYRYDDRIPIIRDYLQYDNFKGKFGFLLQNIQNFVRLYHLI